MLIPVRYLDGRHDFVKPWLLDRFIDEMRVVEFRRSCGWVHVHRDPVRRKTGGKPPGEERRGEFHPGGPLLAGSPVQTVPQNEREGPGRIPAYLSAFFFALAAFLALVTGVPWVALSGGG